MRGNIYGLPWERASLGPLKPRNPVAASHIFLQEVHDAPVSERSEFLHHIRCFPELICVMCRMAIGRRIRLVAIRFRLGLGAIGPRIEFVAVRSLLRQLANRAAATAPQRRATCVKPLEKSARSFGRQVSVRRPRWTGRCY